ncbi:hypothetical protein DEIGR_310079 [Deinococcus grandis]|uniref:DUF6504 domain-containing protein n=1 Tax=Deinococcus grandis TaxID=57498 RepID=A0A100HMQ1_9DEIO|nr:DUF6504 family protein [Deinococcus grandis]BBN97177.1 hypothetical protein DEGR_39100 [Deinococcus grandis]GAQ23560.1 hypothetical protein DEIGR_310079 [Deinococcus grandis]
MKAYQHDIQVQVQDQQPVRLTWHGQTYRVQAVIDEWRAGGRWWLGERPRTCYLVQAGELTAEVHREDGEGGRWWLARLQD